MYFCKIWRIPKNIRINNGKYSYSWTKWSANRFRWALQFQRKTFSYSGIFLFFFPHQCYHRENLFLEGSFLNYEIACTPNSLISQSLSISLTHSSIFRHWVLFLSKRDYLAIYFKFRNSFYHFSCCACASKVAKGKNWVEA